MFPLSIAPSYWQDCESWSGVILVTKAESTEVSRAMNESPRHLRSRKMVSLECTTRLASAESTATMVRSAGIMSEDSLMSQGQASNLNLSLVNWLKLCSMALTL